MKNSSARCYKSKQRKATKKKHEKCLNFSDDEKEKSGNMVVNDMKIFLKTKHKGWMSVEKII